jgi:raffinose/stachyose/melibiose transport system permease protein
MSSAARPAAQPTMDVQEGSSNTAGVVVDRRRPQRYIDWKAYLYIAPGFVIVAAFLLYPLAQAVWISFFKWDGLSPATWVGINNYIAALTDPKWLQSFEHVAVLVFFFAVLPVLLGLFLSAVLQRGARMRGIGIFQTLIFLPQVVAAVVIGVIWVSIYAPSGLLNSLLRLIGLGSVTTAWLGNFGTALPAVGFIGTWMEIGLCLVLFLTGISQISQDLYDAARVDGAGPIREFISITLPSLRGSLAVALTLTTIAALKTFDVVFVTTRGGPGTSTTVPAFQVYNLAFNQGQVGMATTIGVILTVLVLIVTIVIQRINPAGEDR